VAARLASEEAEQGVTALCAAGRRGCCTLRSRAAAPVSADGGRAAARRNELVALDMVMTILTMGFAFVAMIAGIFGMNLSPLPVEDDYVRPGSALCCYSGTVCALLDS
jgi:adenine/guanine phosphoribosyltransferase-like PRPP-binding protein